MPNLVALSLMLSDKKIFKDFEKKIFKDSENFEVLLPWQPEFLKESNSFKNSGPWQKHSCEISSKLDK